jgi:formyltetrahydrofolate-dependent phosphoribosylglycinamide formyltransferase
VTIRLAVLLSGSGSTLENLFERIDKGVLDAEVAVVVSSRADAFGLERARRRGVPAFAVVRREHPDTASFSRAIHAVLEPHAPDLVVLAGFLCKLALGPYSSCTMNIHPALIPAFSGKGFYGEHVHRAVLETGVKLTGATVHFCDDEYDQGPIVLQEAVAVEDGDTVESLGARVQALERELLPRAIQLFAEGRLAVEGRRVRILPPGTRS